MAAGFNDKYSPRKIGTIVDSVHIVIGILEVILTIVAISDTDRFKLLFPLIFLLAGVLFGVTAWYSVATYQKNKTKRLTIALCITAAVFLMLLFVVSSVSLWFH